MTISNNTYKTYKNSGIEWIGEIPRDWNVVTLKRVFSDRCGGAWGEDAKSDEFDRICIRIADFDYSKMSVKKDIEYTKRNYNPDVIAKLTLQKNDILIEKSGGGEQTPVGRTIIFNEEFKALYANFMDRLRVRVNNSPKFIQYTLNSFYQNGITYQYIKQTTGIQNLDLTNLLAKEYIVLPRKIEQQQIADYLDKKCGEIDRVVETQKDIIEKLKEYKQSVITEAVTKGLDKSAPLKDSGIEWIGKIPQHWNINRGKNVLTLLKREVENNMEVITCFRDGQVTLRSNRREDGFTFADKECGYQGIFVGDLVIHGMDGFAGAIGISDSKGKGSPVLNVCNPKNNYSARYICYYLRMLASQNIFVALATGIRERSCDLRWQKIANLLFILPSIDEQQQIVKYLDKKCSEIDSAISDKEQLIEKLAEYKKSLIYECVTGKRKVC